MAMMWERVRLNMKAKEVSEGKKAPGRKGGIMGPGRRWGHTCNSVKNGRLLYVFGGYGKDNCQTNDVHVYDYSKGSWSKPMVKGAVPSPRDSHSCTAVGTELFVFGGTDGKNPLSDLYILDTTTNTWSQPNVTGQGPTAREGHSSTLVGRNLFIFGGCGKAEDEDEIYYNDLYILDTVSYHWTKCNTRGTPPTARDSHSCTTWDNKIVIVAGEDASDSYLSDVHILDPGTLEWKELKTSGQILEPRAGHSAISLGKHLFVFAGFTDARSLYNDIHVLNLETGVWTKVETSGDIPSPRFSVAGDCLDSRKGILVYIGGCNEQLEALDDMYYLHTDMSVENGQDEQKSEKFSLRKELKRRRLEHQASFNDSEKEKEVIKSDTYIKYNFSGNMAIAGPSVAVAAPSNSLYEFKPSGERIFEARITDVFHYGYTITSTIDGRPMRGLIFSNKPGFAHSVNEHLKRKRKASEYSTLPSNDMQKQTARRMKQAVKRARIVQNVDPVTHFSETTHVTSPTNPPTLNLASTTETTVTDELPAPKSPSKASHIYQQYVSQGEAPAAAQKDASSCVSERFATTHSSSGPVSSPPSKQAGLFAIQTLPQPSNEGNQGNQATSQGNKDAVKPNQQPASAE